MKPRNLCFLSLEQIALERIKTYVHFFDQFQPPENKINILNEDKRGNTRTRGGKGIPLHQ